jgi:hypothetical protein
MPDAFGSTVAPQNATPDSMGGLKLALSWLFVGIPLAYGVWRVIVGALALFK